MIGFSNKDTIIGAAQSADPDAPMLAQVTVNPLANKENGFYQSIQHPLDFMVGANLSNEEWQLVDIPEWILNNQEFQDAYSYATNPERWAGNFYPIRRIKPAQEIANFQPQDFLASHLPKMSISDWQGLQF